jgi:RNA-directed DNA polymerase
VLAPLLGNIYLHYVFDVWVQSWRKKRARGDVIAVRYADDFVLGFERREDAEQFLSELRERFTRFGLELHADKTRLIEFGRFASTRRRRRGDGKPETFDFLGFTHICGKTRKGKYTVLRRTMRKRLTAKLKEVEMELRRRRHDPIPEQGAYLRAVLRGHFQYYGVPLNSAALDAFRWLLGRIWHRSLARRSQRGRLDWPRMRRLIGRWFPPARICHPYPLDRFGVIT